MKESISQKIYESFDEAKFKYFSLLDDESGIQVLNNLLEGLEKFVNKEKTDADSHFPLRKTNQGPGIYVGASNEEKSSLRKEEFIKRLRQMSYHSLGLSDYVEIENEIFRNKFLPALSKYLKKGIKKASSIEEIKQELINSLKIEFDLYKEELIYFNEKCDKISINYYQYLKPYSITENSEFIINWGELSSKAITFGKYDNGRKYINTISQRYGSQASSIQYIKQIDTKDSNIDFLSFFTISNSKLIKIVLYRKDFTLLERTVIDLKTQLKKIKIIDENILQIFQTGFSEPEIIVFKKFEEARNFEEKIHSIHMT